MQKIQNLLIAGSKEKPISLDIFYKKSELLQPIIIFCHGFKGFKNWGHYDLVAEEFANRGFVFVKFNFSYNGTTLEQPTDFADLEAFGNNNFSIELEDTGLVIDYVEKNAQSYHADKNKIYLIGHSRGGGITILRTFEDKHVRKLVTWASVKDAHDFFIMQDIEQWKADGFISSLNARTQQKMPLYFQIYEDYIANKDRLDIMKAAANIDVPWLIVHGTNDEAVPFSYAEKLHQLNENSELFIVENGNHTFGGNHPWNENSLPADVKLVVSKTIDFFLKQ